MNKNERQIVCSLAESVRAMTLEQIAATWWSSTRWGKSRAKVSLEALVSDGWIHFQRALVRKIHQPLGPLVAWEPGDAQPELEELARVLHRRAVSTDAKFTTVAYAAKRAVLLFGSGPAPSVKLTQLTHDLNVSEVYLRVFRSRDDGTRWLSEDRLPSDWPMRERPDAVLVDESGKTLRAIEYGGDYPVSRLQELHTAFANTNLGYELW